MKHHKVIIGIIIMIVALVPLLVYRSTVTEDSSGTCTKEDLTRIIEENKEDIDDIIRKEILFNIVLIGLYEEKELEARS